MDKGIIVHTVIHDGLGKILIIRRSKDDEVCPSEWDIPGGTLEDGEDPQEGAKREVTEETGLHISKLSLFDYTANVDESKNKQFIRLIFIAKTNQKQVSLNLKDHDEYEWIDLKDINSKYALVDYIKNILLTLQSKNHELMKL